MEPLGILAGLLGLLSTTHSSVKGLCKFIASTKESGDHSRDITTGLDEINSLLSSLEVEILENGAKYPPHTRHASESLAKVIKSCQSSCDEFKTKLVKTIPLSADGVMSFRVDFHLDHNELSCFKEMLAHQKAAISTFLQIANL